MYFIIHRPQKRVKNYKINDAYLDIINNFTLYKDKVICDNDQ